MAVKVIDFQPLVTQQHQINSAHADHSKQLAKRLYKVIRGRSSESSLRLTLPEINGLSALLHRAVAQIAVDIKLSEQGATLSSTVSLAKVISGAYINFSTTLLPSAHGINLSEVKLGTVTLSGDFSMSLIKLIVDYFTGEDTAQQLLDTVRAVAIKNDELEVTLNVLEDLLALTSEQSLFNSLRDNLTISGDKELIKQYYQYLISQSPIVGRNTSLADFFNLAFSYINQLNLKQPASSYVEQNRAMLVALALYFGHDNFAVLIGNIDKLTRTETNRQRIHRRSVTLAGRNDLQKHFIYSVAIQLLSNNSASDAIGEFKEFLDSNKGGSGFSFVDLLADRAGTRLANIATYSEQQGQQIQALLVSVTDEALLPSIENLAEGLDQQTFENKYQGVDSKQYQQVLKQLDSHLKTLPLYQMAWR
ncbi:hypothetical protein [Colwellia sp. MEBiC06753]